MKQILMVGLVLGLARAAGAAPAGGTVLATVNGEPITQDALVQRLLAYHGKPMLEAMINRTLVAQEAKRLNVSVPDAEVNSRLGKIKTQLGGAESYGRWLAQSGLVESQHRDQVRMTLLTEKIIQKTDPVKDAELDQAAVRVIVLPNEEDAKSVAGILKNGGDFIQLARERSVDRGTGEQGGLLPPITRVELPEVWRAIESLKPGQTSGPVKLGDNWAVLKLEQRRPASAQSDQEKERNRARLLSSKMERWLDTERSKAKIKYETPLP